MLRTRALRFAAVTAAASLALAACGGDGGEGAGGTDGGEGEPLIIGAIFPETGDLSHLGPPQIEAAEYAVQEINAAGGVLGQEIPTLLRGDEANDPARAGEAADRILADGADAIIGAASTGMTMSFIDRVIDAEVVQCSGSNTAPNLTTYEDNGFYFRTAPSDALQGPVLAETVFNDGHSTVAIAFRADDYGQGLADATAAGLEELGAEVVMNEGYDPNSANFDAVVNQITNAEPDAVVLPSFEEGVQILTPLLEAGYTPDQIYSADGMRSETMGETVDPDDPGVIGGFSGTAPASVENEEFDSGLREFAPELEVFQYAPQVFDCVTIVALAAEAAGSTSAADFSQEMVNVTREGEACSSFAECRDLLADGTDINYEGASGPVDFTDAGEPGTARIEIWEHDDEGVQSVVDTVDAGPL
ncbi:ABC transporter substrate-binding protein [Allonocardiopsis opalescens]|uniref:Amino acid/amide ABC transporter substrate-binding protein (HAAT family) n=1 Tax=Allonocardiopsis opalescens TaxID=1144618 RepID=A0A2T0Q4J6_9ACTN|nr:ABC transporter substrate-binding protein [Allonocardiopsis opalescens]PRX98631.1 amino acid/amide ABC transporter substrate-binding protein (HAAT family) [Allonocardiopsis opalescens]